jgi:hypothetical protein
MRRYMTTEKVSPEQAAQATWHEVDRMDVPDEEVSRPSPRFYPVVEQENGARGLLRQPGLTVTGVALGPLITVLRDVRRGCTPM